MLKLDVQVNALQTRETISNHKETKFWQNFQSSVNTFNWQRNTDTKTFQYCGEVSLGCWF